MDLEKAQRALATLEREKQEAYNKPQLAVQTKKSLNYTLSKAYYNQ